MKNKKIIGGICIILLVITCLTILLVNNFTFGYAYYDQNSMLISIEESDNLEQKMNVITQSFIDKGFNVINCSFSKISSKKIITKKQNIVKEKSALDDFLNKEVKVEVSLKKLRLSQEDLIYYFKNEQECNDFIKAINISDYTVEDYAGDYQLITSEEVLKDKIVFYEELQKKEQEKKQRKITSVTSRSGNRGTIAAPMETYVYISSYYGWRNGELHTGVDFAAPANTEIYAWKDGIITFADWSGGYGKFIIIEHEDGSVSRYAHCNDYAVEVGQSVAKGTTIGYVGTTGRSTGYHLHFEILIDDEFINPLTLITK